MRVVLIGLCLGSALANPSALAQPGSTIGLPADPFASNYPSEPPPRQLGASPGYGAVRRGPAARLRRSPRGVKRLVPPADIPAGAAR